jgi:hypothetical protein
MAANAFYKREDHSLVFGSATVFIALTSAAAFISVFLRSHLEDQAGRMFALLTALSVILLVLAAYDWGRRKLLAAAALIAAVLSLFIVRVGFESLKVPPQWARAQVAAQAKADEDALQLQYKNNVSTLRKTATDASTALGHVISGPPRPNVDPALLDQARKIFASANHVIQLSEAGNADDYARFDTLVGDEGTNYPLAATTRLADAVHALQAAESAAAPPPSTKALNQAVCVIDPPPPADRCLAGRAPPITTNHDWVTAQHVLNVQLATYRAQVTGTAADQAALQTVEGQQPEADEDISILSAVENGPQTLWRSAFHASGPALVPGPLGWVLLGALLLWLLSALLKVNASQQAGPVSVTPVTSGGGDDKSADGDGKSGSGNDQLTAALRVAVLQNVAEPGSAPGSPSTNPVTTLLGIAGGSLSGLSKAVEAVQAVIGRRYGYQVAVDVTSGDLADSSLETGGAASTAGNSAGTTAVLVRVMSLTSGATYASHLCQSPSPLAAVRTAGLWAAGDILNRSSRIPHWAAWQAETAHALVTAKNQTVHNIPELEAALTVVPNSGILLVLLGHQYELTGRPLDAIECYARAVTAYPRYGVARYRLAVALASMHHQAFGWRCSGDQAERENGMLRAVRAAVDKLGVQDGGALAAASAQTAPGTTLFQPQPSRHLFKAVAANLLRALERDTTRRYLLVDALRRSERKSVWPSLVPLSKHPAARFHDLVRSALRALEGQRDDLDKATQKDGSWWQVSYNAACCHAARITAADGPPGTAAAPAEEEGKKETQEREASKALDYLEQTLVRPGVEQLSADWVSRDPDLAVLRALPRFQRFLTQLRPGE